MHFILSTSQYYTKMAFIFKPAWQAQGKGARVLRLIGGEHLKHFDPFIVLDFFKVKLPAGFPDHPHRGFETVTYMLEGKMHHQDFKGHKGTIKPGDVQWMTAGKGILHSEIPGSEEEYSLGLQLWVNLSKQQKFCDPAYQEFTSDKLEAEAYHDDKIDVKIISGEWKGKKGPVYARTPAYFFDVHLQAGAKFNLPLPVGWNTIVFPYEGQLLYQDKQRIENQYCCVLDKGKEGEEQFNHSFTSDKGTKFILIGGQPLNEPIMQKRFFVMNNAEELDQAFDDFEKGKNGFEGADKWSSKIKELMKGKKLEQL